MAVLRPGIGKYQGNGFEWEDCDTCDTKWPKGMLVRQDGKLRCPHCVCEPGHGYYYRKVVAKKIADEARTQTVSSIGVKTE